MKPRRVLRPVDPSGRDFVTVTPRRVRIVGHTKGATVYVNGREAAIGDEVRAGDTLGIALNTSGAIIPPLHVDVEES